MDEDRSNPPHPPHYTPFQPLPKLSFVFAGIAPGRMTFILSCLSMEDRPCCKDCKVDRTYKVTILNINEVNLILHISFSYI